jgi:hypothetical protein
MKTFLAASALVMALLVHASGQVFADTNLTVATAGGYSPNGVWKNFGFAQSSGVVQATFSISGCQQCTGYLGFSNGSITDYDFAAVVNFNNNGIIHTISGSPTVAFTAGTTYTFRLVVNTSAGTYDAFVKAGTAAEQSLGTGIGFGKPGVTSLGDFGFIMWNSFTLSDVQLSSSVGTPPAPVNHTKTQLAVPPTVSSGNHQYDPLALAGYLDVTLYGADPSGVQDSTQAIQNAINDGIKYSMLTYVPPGTYVVSSSLEAVQPCIAPGNSIGTIQQFGMHKAPSLVGPSAGPRPTIVLRDNTTGFTDPTHPRPLLHLVSLPGGPSDPTCEGQYSGNTDIGAFDVLFDTVVRDISFKLGNNPGAIGVRFFSAQMSYMQNVSVDATGAYTGINGGPETDTWINIDITGGQYGIALSHSACGTNTIVGLSLKNQTDTGIFGDTCGATVISGFNIQENGIPAAKLAEPGFQGGTLALLDGSITITGASIQQVANCTPSSVICNQPGLALSLNNVYVKAPHAALLVANSAQATAASSPTASGNWDWFREYVHNDAGTYIESFGGGYALNGYTVVNDVMTKNDYSALQANSAAPPADLIARHVPGPLPGPFDASAVWVTDLGADPTGATDSTAALRAAISASDSVFLPRGQYSISGTLQLNPNTKLFGVPGFYSVLTGFGWVTGKAFQPFIRTANSSTGTAIVSDLGIEMPVYDKTIAAYTKLLPPGTAYDPVDTSYLSAFDWQTGQNSIMNQVEISFQYTGMTLPPAAARKLLQVENNGGGRWYGLQVAGDNNPFNPDARVLSVTGTTAPLTLYGSNPEHTAGLSMYDFSNASNIRVLGLKTEGGQNTSLISIGSASNNIQVLGVNGDVPRSLTISNATNLDFTTFSYYGNKNLEEGKGGSYITDDKAGYPFTNAYSLFKLGAFNDSVFTHCNGC